MKRIGYNDLIYQIQRFNREFDLKLAAVLSDGFIRIYTSDLATEIFRVRHTNLDDAVWWLIRFRTTGYFYEYHDVLTLDELPTAIKANYHYIHSRLTKFIKLWQQVKKEQSSRL